LKTKLITSLLALTALCGLQASAAVGPVMRTYAVSALPSASAASGSIEWISDSNTASSGGACTGGGTFLVPCKSNGTTWTVLGVGSASSIAPNSYSFSSQTSVLITHNLATLNVIVQCYNAATPSVGISGKVTRTDTNNITVEFLSAQSGSCVVNGGVGPQGPAGSGGAAPVSYTFTSASSVTMNHNLHTLNVLVGCYSNASPHIAITGVASVVDIDNAAIAFMAPQSGYCVVNGGVGPQGPAGPGGSAPTAYPFTSATSLSINHNLHTLNVLIGCYDNASPRNLISGSVTVADIDNAAVSFLATKTGYCVVNGGVGPRGAAGTSLSSYHLSLTSATTYTVTGATHGLGTVDLTVHCLDAATPSASFIPAFTVDRTTFDVVISLLQAKSGGSCFIR
jgi:hypothetical protein